MLTRRQFVLTGGVLGAASAGFGTYAFGIEPYRFRTKRYRIRPVGWPRGLTLRIAVLADLHICEPWMPLQQVQSIVANTNAVGADLVVLLGDFVGSKGGMFQALDKAEWGSVLGQLRAPLGVHAILGNHDWWEDPLAQRRRGGMPAVGRALESVGVSVYQNDVMRLKKDGYAFWLCGLGDQWAFYGDRDENLRPATFGYAGVDDLDGTLAQLTDDAPAIMMVHEPDVFLRISERVALTLAGHTHGGQVRLLGYPPIVPSRFGTRYAYGHVREGSRDLVVSGGLGCSVLPVRFGCPPEIVVVDLKA